MSSSDEKVQSFTNRRGQKIHRWQHCAAGTPRAICVMVHGVCDHVLAYESLGKDLWDKSSILLCGYDQVGHGASDGVPVDVHDFQHYVDDCIEYIDILRKEFANLPLFVMGHSMGGLVVCQSVLRKPDLCEGVILYAASIAVNRRVFTPFKIMMAKLLSHILPKCPVGKIPDEFLCRDPQVVKEIQEDPVRWQHGLKARWGHKTLIALEDFESRMAEFKLPVLILHGDADAVTLVDGSTQFHKTASSNDKTLKIYKGAYHRLHKEPEGIGEQFISDISDWMLERSQQTS